MKKNLVEKSQDELECFYCEIRGDILLFPKIKAFLFLFTAACSLSNLALAKPDSKKKPPNLWLDDLDHPAKKNKKTSKYLDYEPKFSFGLGANLPEIFPFESHIFLGPYVALRLFYTPPLPKKIRVEMPSDVISAKNGLAVVNPDITIPLELTYGPHYGIEGYIFPFGGSFFVGGGVSFRKIRLKGDAKSPIKLCSVIEALKEPPCGNDDTAITTKLQLELSADAVTSASLVRTAAGWYWLVGDSFYFTTSFGLARPTGIKRSMTVVASVDAPGAASEVLEDALVAYKKEKEAEMEQKALKEIQPVEERILPILGVSFGLRF